MNYLTYPRTYSKYVRDWEGGLPLPSGLTVSDGSLGGTGMGAWLVSRYVSSLGKRRAMPTFRAELDCRRCSRAAMDGYVGRSPISGPPGGGGGGRGNSVFPSWRDGRWLGRHVGGHRVDIYVRFSPGWGWEGVVVLLWVWVAVSICPVVCMYWSRQASVEVYMSWLAAWEICVRRYRANCLPRSPYPMIYIPH
ncbi:hypothetical protein F4809DRAFT_399273 [Biscogniauxia mediterranea]|nr:hypothetical protein F4809DRAFT_399273 [Biscogniauxia mediterranea]